MMLGLLPMPPEGHLVEDLEAALEVALAMKKLPNPADFNTPKTTQVDIAAMLLGP